MKISVANGALNQGHEFLYFTATPNKYRGFEKQQQLITASPN
jgi:hypothetical protein